MNTIHSKMTSQYGDYNSKHQQYLVWCQLMGLHGLVILMCWRNDQDLTTFLASQLILAPSPLQAQVHRLLPSPYIDCHLTFSHDVLTFLLGAIWYVLVIHLKTFTALASFSPFWHPLKMPSKSLSVTGTPFGTR